MGNLGSSDVDSRLEEQLIDGILYAFQEQTQEVRTILLSCLFAPIPPPFFLHGWDFGAVSKGIGIVWLYIGESNIQHCQSKGQRY